MSGHLFVGGPADGTWHDADPSVPTWRVRVPGPMPVDVGPDDPALLDLRSSVADYKPVDFHYGHRKLVIYQHVGIDLDPLGLLHHLCKEYRK